MEKQKSSLKVFELLTGIYAFGAVVLLLYLGYEFGTWLK